MAITTNKKDENKAGKAPRRLALGTGLGALFDDGGEVPISPAAETNASKYTGENNTLATEDADNKVIYIGINDIKPNSDQPRKSFDEEKILVVINPEDSGCEISVEGDPGEVIYSYGEGIKTAGNICTISPASAAFVRLSGLS